MLNPQDVFDVYPEVNEIYEVNGMPFLTEQAAAGHAKTLLDKDKRDIITHKRQAKATAKPAEAPAPATAETKKA